MQRKSVKDWAHEQKRVTNMLIRKTFDVDAETADYYYRCLKDDGIVGRMGFVKGKVEK